jgi:hypothetical protein
MHEKFNTLTSAIHCRNPLIHAEMEEEKKLRLYIIVGGKS